MAKMFDMMQRLHNIAAMLSKPLYLIETDGQQGQEQNDRGGRLRIEPVFPGANDFKPEEAEIAPEAETLDEIRAMQAMLEQIHTPKRVHSVGDSSEGEEGAASETEAGWPMGRSRGMTVEDFIKG